MSTSNQEGVIDVAVNCTKKSRKRTRNPTKHKAYEKKRKVQTGGEHETKSQKIIEKKEFHVQITCRCKKMCAERINALRQGQIFKCFYELKNWTQKTLYLQKCVKKVAAKENLNPVIRLKERNSANKYYLNDEIGEQHEVCLGFLTDAFQITQSKMRSVTKTLTLNEKAKDDRGKFPTRKTNDSDVAFVKDFIGRFPTYESHYRLSRADIKYLSPFLNIEKMYREYCLRCKFYRKTPVSNWYFRHVFNTEFHLSFARLKVDTCRTCDKFKALTELEKLQQNIEQETHWKLAENIKNEFAETVTFASNPENYTEVFTFDLQRAYLYHV